MQKIAQCVPLTFCDNVLEAACNLCVQIEDPVERIKALAKLIPALSSAVQAKWIGLLQDWIEKLPRDEQGIDSKETKEVESAMTASPSRESADLPAPTSLETFKLIKWIKALAKLIPALSSAVQAKWKGIDTNKAKETKEVESAMAASPSRESADLPAPTSLALVKDDRYETDEIDHDGYDDPRTRMIYYSIGEGIEFPQEWILTIPSILEQKRFIQKETKAAGLSTEEEFQQLIQGEWGKNTEKAIELVPLLPEPQ